MTSVYVIYCDPTDYPYPFVMRIHKIGWRRGERKIETTDMVRIGSTLADVRRSIPPGKQRHDRAEADEPQIVEWWA